jgi:hypothetical protein
VEKGAAGQAQAVSGLSRAGEARASRTKVVSVTRRVLFAGLAALNLAACASASGDKPQILAATPASIELAVWCPGSLGDDPACRQAAADLAQAHCQRFQQNAQYQRSALMQRDALLMNTRVGFSYACVR